MIEHILSLAWIVLVGFIARQLFSIIQFYIDMKRYRGMRFVTVPAHLVFKAGETKEPLTDDLLLAKLLQSDEDEEQKDKFVNINYTLDLEQVRAYHEYTVETNPENKVSLNYTYVVYKNGNTVVLDLTFFQFDEILTNYYNRKYNLI